MVRAVAFLIALSISANAFAQGSVRVLRVWNISWKAVSTQSGQVTRVPVFVFSEPPPPSPGGRYTAPPEISLVIRLEDRLREAERTNDAATIERILSDRFFATDANGVGRDKAATMASLDGTEPAPVPSNNLTARATDNAVVLTGEETGGTPDRAFYTHVYVRESSGEWTLLSSTLVRLGR